MCQINQIFLKKLEQVESQMMIQKILLEKNKEKARDQLFRIQLELSKQRLKKE